MKKGVELITLHARRRFACDWLDDQPDASGGPVGIDPELHHWLRGDQSSSGDFRLDI
jgi:hypothetical protein